MTNCVRICSIDELETHLNDDELDFENSIIIELKNGTFLTVATRLDGDEKADDIAELAMEALAKSIEYQDRLSAAAERIADVLESMASSNLLGQLGMKRD